MNSSNVKVWITGYSRAAATANLVGQKVISSANKGLLPGVESDDVFTYCFECPRNVTETYLGTNENPINIFNIVNESDLVTHVAFERWSYDRFGMAYYLPSLTACGFHDYPYAWSAMIYKYRDIIQAMGYSEDVAFDLATECGTLALGQEGLVDSIAELIGAIGYDPRWYYEHYQDIVTAEANEFFDIDKQENTDNKFLTDILLKVLDKWVEKDGFSDPMSYGAFKALLAMAGSGLMHGHFPELCMAWLDALDGTEDYYSSDVRTRLLILNCPVDVDVYYQGQLVGRIQNDKAVDIGGNSLCVLVDHNGQKKVYLPAVDDYEIKITARDSGKMSYQIEERDIDSGELYRIVNYIDVDIDKDNQLTGTVSAMNESGLSYYSLYSPNGTEIAPTMDLKDGIAQYYVSLKASGNGYVSPGGLMNVGEYIKASAEAKEGSEFVGWFKGNQLISEEAEYRFCVLEDTELTAVFRSIVLDEDQLTLGIGEHYQIKPVIEPVYSADTELSYESLDENVAVVDESGTITGVNSGTTSVVIKANEGLHTYLTVTVAPNGIYIKNLDPSYMYTGNAIKPAISVYDSGTLLKPKTDYTVTYKNTTKAYTLKEDDPEFNAKKAPQIIIKSNSKGNYKGSKTVYFTIEPVELMDDSISVDELSAQAGTKPISPVPVVYFNGKKLKAKTDYTVDYNGWNQMDPGDHTIKIEGKGNFQGTRNVKMHVASSDLISVDKLKVTAKTLKYADLHGDDFEEDIEWAITVKNGKQTVYSYEYYFEDIPEDYKKAGTLKFTLVGREEEGYYGKKTVTIKIAGIALTDKKVKSATGLSYPYTGEEVTFTPETTLVTYGGIDLVERTDYVIDSYTKNLNAGTATVLLKGINNYTGTRKVTFKITPDTTAHTRKITVEPAVYAKGGSKPKVTVEGLTEGTDYTVKYGKNNAAEKTGTATVIFKGNYKGSQNVPLTFDVGKKDLSKVAITAKDLVYKYGKYQSTPILTDTDGKKLKAGVDYEKTYEYTGDIIDGNALYGAEITVTVTGRGNYTGTASTTYRIIDAGSDISKGTFRIANQEYTGKEILITDMSQFTGIEGLRDAYVKVDGEELYLELGKDFEVVPGSYVKNINKGTAKVTFRGIGDYGGTKTVSFKIGQRSITDYWQGMKNFFSKLF